VVYRLAYTKDIRLVGGLCTRMKTIIRKHPLICVGTPLGPPSSPTLIAQYNVLPPRASFIAIIVVCLKRVYCDSLQAWGLGES